MITEGTAVVTVEGRQVALLGPGDHYGEVRAAQEVGHTHGRRMATVTAQTDLWVSVMSIAEFATLLIEFPDVADAVRRAARDRVATATH